MTISGIKLNARPIEGVREFQQTEKPQNQQSQGPKGFGEMFKEALVDVNEMQLNADQQIEGLMLGKEGVTTHDAMIALEKADVAFQLMNQIRSKIVRAYQEVIRTQI